MVMKWLDQAGYACAAQWSGCYCVTVSVGGIRFKKPIHVGEFVELNAKVVHTGKTCIHIFISVNAGDPKSPELSETGTCIMSFVAVDDEGNPAEVEMWVPETKEDELLQEFAIHAKEFSQKLQSELD